MFSKMGGVISKKIYTPEKNCLFLGDNGEFPLLFTIPYGVLSITPTQVKCDEFRVEIKCDG